MGEEIFAQPPTVVGGIEDASVSGEEEERGRVAKESASIAKKALTTGEHIALDTAT